MNSPSIVCKTFELVPKPFNNIASLCLVEGLPGLPKGLAFDELHKDVANGIAWVLDCLQDARYGNTSALTDEAHRRGLGRRAPADTL